MSANPFDSLNDGLAAGANNTARAEMIEDLRRVLMAGFGGGALVRGLSSYLSTPNKAKSKQPVLDELPLPVVIKSANEPAAPASGGLLPTSDSLKRFFGGQSATAKGGLPYYLPAMVGGLLASSYAGWKGTDYVIDAINRRKKQKEIDDAKSRFQAALKAQYTGEKIAGDDRLNVALDKLYKHVKAANTNDVLGGLTGAYLTYAGLSGLLGAIGGYNLMHKRSPAKLVEDAVIRRDAMRATEAPGEIYAVPEPIEPDEIKDRKHRSMLERFRI